MLDLSTQPDFIAEPDGTVADEAKGYTFRIDLLENMHQNWVVETSILYFTNVRLWNAAGGGKVQKSGLGFPEMNS